MNSGGFIAGGDQGLVVSSANGTGWTVSFYDGSVTEVWHTVLQGSPDWMAGGNGGDFASNPGGTQWTVRNCGSAVALESVVQGPGAYVGAGQDANGHGVVLSTADPTTGNPWARVAGSTSALWTIAYSYTLGEYLAAGENGTLLVSSDGASWSAAAGLGSGDTIYALADCGGRLFAAGHDAWGGLIESSTDGTHWTVELSGAPFGLHALACANLNVVAVGDGGLIVTR
jgi:hypothetical protein